MNQCAVAMDLISEVDKISFLCKVLVDLKVSFVLIIFKKNNISILTFDTVNSCRTKFLI